ncbi:Phosphatidylglycerol/phosphatidylinositol transfer protein [Entomophthora muscae]|uniref:Phosphatidylglycerol/phosphatidylinositol transfer protein n=1 Tax=Entomophthora muscae TaxID=34485 RepID=A0ACC2U765_9FUNG|nr:Phosphatidylglycerol/phosphatidylinositol transfer protein [Entomophthora muscae]
MQFQSLFFTLFAATQVASQGCKPMAGGVVSNCGNNKDAFVIQNIKLMGTTTRGSELTVKLDGILRETVTKGAKVTIKVKRRGRTLLNVNRDICDLLTERKIGYTCPVKAQKVSKTHKIKIPGYIPPGEYETEVTGINSNNRRIFKVNVKTTF